MKGGFLGTDDFFRVPDDEYGRGIVLVRHDNGDWSLQLGKQARSGRIYPQMCYPVWKGKRINVQVSWSLPLGKIEHARAILRAISDQIDEEEVLL